MVSSVAEIGFGGPVDFTSQNVILSNHVDTWQDFPLASSIQRELDVPVVIDNDANLGALGEALYGAGIGYDPLFYVTLSTGIGGGLVIDGNVLPWGRFLCGRDRPYHCRARRTGLSLRL